MAMATSVEEALAYAATKLGYESLKTEQKEAVKSFLEGNDVFVSLPTGFGKSLCFALLPYVFDYLRGDTDSPKSIVLCVSPLTSLMMDQRNKFSPRGLRCEFVGEAQEDQQVRKDIDCGKYQLVYLSPESLLTNIAWKETLRSPTYRKNLVALVVDEAHLVKKWGVSFRQEFSRLGEIRSILPPDVNIMALTATATMSTRRYVIKHLCMNKPRLIYKSPAKSNLLYIVKKKPPLEDLAKAIAVLLRTGEDAAKGIIFCRYYKECSQLYLLIKKELGVAFTSPVGAPDLHQFRRVEMYTRCTETSLKEKIVASFADPASRLRIVIGTIAFGMGLDCPCVRYVVHFGPASDVESYVQETGRGGRDGKLCIAILFYTRADQQYTQKSMMDYCALEPDAGEAKCRRQKLLTILMVEEKPPHPTASAVIFVQTNVVVDFVQLFCQCVKFYQICNNLWKRFSWMSKTFESTNSLTMVVRSFPNDFDVCAPDCVTIPVAASKL